MIYEYVSRLFRSERSSYEALKKATPTRDCWRRKDDALRQLIKAAALLHRLHKGLRDMGVGGS